jgi:hypothetical protein
MRLRGVVLVSALLFPAVASGQEWAAVVITSGGYTQQEGADGDTNIELTTNVQPSLALTWLAGNTTNRLSYNLSLTYFPTADNDQSAISNTAAWQTAWLSGPVSTWLFDVSAVHTQNAALTLLTAPEAGTGGAVVALPTQTLTLGAGQGYQREIGPRWRITEGLVGSYLIPLGDDSEATIGKTAQGTLALGIDRTLHHGSLGLQVLGSVVAADVTNLATGEEENQQTGTGTLIARHTRELSLRWSGEAFAGSSLVARLDTSRGAFAPTFGVSTSWLGDKGSAGFSASRTTTFNPFLAQTLLTDTVLLSGTRPLAKSPIIIAGTLSYAHGKTIASTLPEDQVINTFTADGSLGYELSEFSVLSFRYQYIYQSSPDPLLIDGGRHSAVVTYTARWPRELRTVMPVRQPLRMLRAPTIEEPGAGGGRRPPPNAL